MLILGQKINTSIFFVQTRDELVALCSSVLHLESCCLFGHQLDDLELEHEGFRGYKSTDSKSEAKAPHR